MQLASVNYNLCTRNLERSVAAGGNVAVVGEKSVNNRVSTIHQAAGEGRRARRKLYLFCQLITY